MEEKKEEGHTCSCGAHCACGGHHKHRMAKRIFMLIAFIIMFAFGMQIGELKGELRSMREEHGMMRSYGYDNQPDMMGGMMYGQNQNNWVPPVNPTVPTTTAPTPTK